MNLLLLRAGYPPVPIEPEHRAAYIQALDTRQTGHDREPYDLFMRERLLDSLQRYLDHLDAGVKRA